MTSSATLPASGAPARARPAGRGSRLWVLPAVFLLGLLGVLGAAVLGQDEEPGAPLGAVATVPGGLARVNGVLPEEPDAGAPAAGSETAEDGTHRVRILLELTALEPGGVDFDAADWEVERLGGESSRALHASVQEQALAQGEALRTELLFEVPDRALELTLEGPRSARLSLGTDHHRGGGPR
ncbi:hypothetical protein [uncultured Kocuria sp.]|uniref:hypothetical protein n=1 Tax=uncultured Kocuria sp. TaxID=259305 RepID=UPI00261E5F21|nr:hypothetical protein [uncultured Kocuria sp.]